MTLVSKDGNGVNQNIRTATIGGELVQEVKPALGSTATITAPAQSTSDGTLIASNSSRISVEIQNDATAGNLLVAYGVTASLTVFTVSLAPGSFISISNYYGVLHGIWDASGSGHARVTEITP